MKIFFENINTEKKAYWLGFIYADGYIAARRKHSSRRLGISITESDVELLKKFKEDIESTHPINTYKSATTYNSQPYVRILIASEKLVSDIEKLGVFEQKTEVLRFPTECQVPKHLIHHFIRGYMDGDGSISSSVKNIRKTAFYVGFCGTREFLQGIQDYFGLSLTLGKRHDNDINNYSISIGGNRQAEKVLNILYKDATVFLTRKHSKYIELKKENEKMDKYLAEQRLELEREKDYIIAEYHKVKNISHLAKQLGISTAKIGDILRERKIKTYIAHSSNIAT